jgi:serine/threonine protein kinase
VLNLEFHEDRPCLVMEYVPGHNFEQCLLEEKPTPQQAAGWLAQLAGAVESAHRRGVIHLDIKPRNILLDEQPRLIDFGVARLEQIWDGKAASGQTTSYLAPEQTRQEIEKIGERSDIFGLGAVLYFLLTGHAPFEGKDETEALVCARRCDFDQGALKAAGVPDRLAAICLRAMAANPADRYGKATELRAALATFQRASGSGVWLTRWLPAAVAVCAAAGAAFWFWSCARRPE